MKNVSFALNVSPMAPLDAGQEASLSADFSPEKCNNRYLLGQSVSVFR